MRATNSRGGANMRHLGAAGWQPTAFTASNAGYKQHGWGQHEASWGCRLATYSIYSQQCGLQIAGVGPTWGILGCRLATYSIYSQQCGLQTAGVVPTRGILGLQVGNLQHLQPAMRATNSRGGANMRHLGAAGWQPTAFTASNAGYKQQGWGQHEASWGCRLATYSIYSQQCGLQTTWVGPTRGILGLQVGNLQHLQPAMWDPPGIEHGIWKSTDHVPSRM